MSNLTSYNYHVCSSFFFFSFHIGALQYPFCSAWRSEKSLSCPYFTKYAFEIIILDHIIWSVIHGGHTLECNTWSRVCTHKSVTLRKISVRTFLLSNLSSLYKQYLKDILSKNDVGSTSQIVGKLV